MYIPGVLRAMILYMSLWMLLWGLKRGSAEADCAAKVSTDMSCSRFSPPQSSIPLFPLPLSTGEKEKVTTSKKWMGARSKQELRALMGDKGAFNN